MSDAPEQNLKAPLRRLTGVQIIATGSYVPDIVVRNEDLAKYGCDPEWILQRTGIRERRHVAAGSCVPAIWPRWPRAAGDATAPASRRPISICWCSARSRPICRFPPPPARCNTSLGCTARRSMCRRPARASCTPWSPRSQFVATGCSRLALVIGADANSRIVDPHDKKTYPLFGDGAGAVLLAAAATNQGLIAYTMGADGSGEELLCMKAGGSRNPASVETVQRGEHFMRMDGRPIFKWAIRLIDRSVRDVLEHAKHDNRRSRSVSCCTRRTSAFSTPPPKSWASIAARCSSTSNKYGNTSAGSIPLALDEAVQQGRIHRGSNILLCGFGAGLTWGTALWRW